MQENTNHEIKILDRSFMSLTGVNKIVSFDPNEFIIETVMGPIHIKGSLLELINLDTDNGVVRIKGKVYALSYLDKDKKTEKESIIAKLFK